ncbi:MAG: response regulator transcription factor [Sphingomonadaceae bacterium]|nr:response regulator transcription factor [Sphingomonadaceae bacterium]
MEQRHKIYLVDDDEAVRRSAGFLLRTTGYDVATYTSGVEMLEEASALEPGCVLLDIRMPEMDGLEVQAELKTRGIPLPVVVMTGSDDIDIAIRAMKAGAVDFIEKPFEKSVLLDAIEESCARLDRNSRRSARADEARVRLDALTPRERDVLRGLVRGHPTKAIADDLGLSPRTVEIHRANVMRNLDVQSLSEALRLAFAAGFGEDAGT